MLYEVAFNLVAIAVIVRYRGRIPVPGDALKLYLLAAGLFRFLVESVRANEPQALGLTGPQWVLIPLVSLLVAHFVRQWVRQAYQVPSPPVPGQSMVEVRDVDRPGDGRAAREWTSAGWPTLGGAAAGAGSERSTRSARRVLRKERGPLHERGLAAASCRGIFR
jgi:hypothetical protein